MIDETSREIQTSDSQVFPFSYWQRWVYGVYIVIAPILSFTYTNTAKPTYQLLGGALDYIVLFLFPESSLLFFPLLTYSVISFILLLADTNRFASFFIVRLGIYSGVFLSLQYCVLLIIFAFDFPPVLFLILLACLLPFIVIQICFWLWSTMKGWILILLAVVIALAYPSFSYITALPLLLGIAAPFWSLWIAGRVALWLLRNRENKFTIAHGLGLTVWLSSYAYALRFNILKMYELYAVTPQYIPNCYIATAAAQGHPRIVRSSVVELKSGKCLRINQQLQRLKCVELTLMVVSPRLHGFVRGVYDVVGKRLAVRIRNPYLADVTYLILAPAEWISFLALKLFLPEIEAASKEIYLRW